MASSNGEVSAVVAAVELPLLRMVSLAPSPVPAAPSLFSITGALFMMFLKGLGCARS